MKKLKTSMFKILWHSQDSNSGSLALLSMPKIAVKLHCPPELIPQCHGCVNCYPLQAFTCSSIHIHRKVVVLTSLFILSFLHLHNKSKHYHFYYVMANSVMISQLLDIVTIEKI